MNGGPEIRLQSFVFIGKSFVQVKKWGTFSDEGHLLSQTKIEVQVSTILPAEISLRPCQSLDGNILRTWEQKIIISNEGDCTCV